MKKWIVAGALFAVLGGACWWASCPVNAAPPTSPGPEHGWNALSAAEARVVESCGTEPPFSGEWLKHDAQGTYTCVRCDAPLFPSDAKFKSGTGWPSFDKALPGSIREVTDSDGHRVEIQCSRCGGHLGHVFRGEGMTSENTRHCVNSVSLDFQAETREEAFFAGGCFWGVESLLEALPGVVSVESGYMGGTRQTPGYREVVEGGTGHAETVRVVFDPAKISYEAVAKHFFEIHDPTQINRQGPDRGSQYRSAVFTVGDAQALVIHDLIGQLQAKGLRIATQVHAAKVFWPAEDYHQDYYRRTGKAPYCHSHTPRF